MSFISLLWPHSIFLGQKRTTQLGIFAKETMSKAFGSILHVGRLLQRCRGDWGSTASSHDNFDEDGGQLRMKTQEQITSHNGEPLKMRRESDRGNNERVTSHRNPDGVAIHGRTTTEER